MKIKMLVSKAGLARPEYGITSTFSLAAGDELDLDSELAEKWIASGHAKAATVDAPDFASLSKRTKAELLNFANEELGLKLDPSLRKEEVVAAIRAELEGALERAMTQEKE